MTHVTSDEIRRSIKNTKTSACDIKKNFRRIERMRRRLKGVKRELERILVGKIEQFEKISMFDEDYRLAAMRGECDYSPSHDADVTSLYGEWLQSCEQYFGDFLELREKGFKLRNSDAFLKCVSEATGILKDDAEFFSKGNLDELRDRAIDEFRRGECEPA